MKLGPASDSETALSFQKVADGRRPRRSFSVPDLSKDAFPFGEGQSRVLISYEEEKEEEIQQSLSEAGVDFRLLGEVKSDSTLRIDRLVELDLGAAPRLYNQVLAAFLHN